MPTESPTSPTTLQLTHTYSAPRERVFAAWGSADIMRQWFAPTDEFTTVVTELDFRVGGRYRIEMRHRRGGVHVAIGVYREIVSPSKIAFTWRWEHAVSDEDSLVTIDLRTVDGGTALTLTQERIPASESKSGLTEGWTGCLARLARVV
jgi:uncharacterized protein YndB with AHSA1/START domain